MVGRAHAEAYHSGREEDREDGRVLPLEGGVGGREERGRVEMVREKEGERVQRREEVGVDVDRFVV